MAIYIRGVKKEETDKYVIYAYGDNYDNLTGKIKILKNPFKLEIIKLQYELAYDRDAFGIAGRIKDYYSEHGSFPDSISKQS